MIDRPLAITATGMVTGVGLDTYSSCAAIRAAIDNFQETRFMDEQGEWIQGCAVPLEEQLQGARKLAMMLCKALEECAAQAQVHLEEIPVIICLSEPERPGIPENLGNKVFFLVQEFLGLPLHRDSAVIKQGRAGGIYALKLARDILYQNKLNHVLVCGVDSLLNAHSIRYFETQDRLLTSHHSDGFIPGEAAAAILLSPPQCSQQNQLLCMGLGFAVEQATISAGLPVRADGLTQALNMAFEEAGSSMNDMDFRIVDVAGEQYWFKEAALALSRLLRVHKQGFPIWHPADCIGEVGAAIVPVCLAYLKVAFEKGFAAGSNIVHHASNDDGQRSVAILRFGAWSEQ
ncbi:beta-ketoacyl synthase N-terminal-like domain-containing protein [Bowmanella yangjiangensis]|uniref:Beta-ketoacyl synthase-like N-terminal domain-containing protein n=1 Tax=Bowmanella yangjiangensis TaxID=2811230 RepID=A0ABS3CZT5_9ALTE|nr:beta-ketoacyl synthase N-terminal-like domain-containing protein [Bowmanella yangjiangensis]MBN7821641.1 hypothetical protein [Bowmanella yangjiangensis]